MFGSNHQDKDSADKAQSATAPDDKPLHAFTMDPLAGPSLPTEPTASPIGDAPSAPHVADGPASDSTPAPSISDLPIVEPSGALTATPTDDEPKVESSLPSPSTRDDIKPEIGNEDLLSIKQQALTELSPLVSHLDQSPEDKFKTLMMMIQANDNQDLIKEAYAAAQEITDDKTKSQALLDIVNEINYFTQKKT